MLVFDNYDKRKFKLYQKDENGNQTLIHDYDLIYSPGSNKYDVLFKFVENMCNTLGKECEDWYIKLINDYKKNMDYEVIYNNIDNIKKYCDEYLKQLNIDFKSYSDKSKASKNSIFFDGEEIKEIIKVSSYLKVYYTLYKDMNMKITQRFNNKIFQKLVEPLTTSPIIIKIHKTVSAKTFEYNQSDKYMWQYIKNMLCRTQDMHITNIFNFVVNFILVTCETDKNPVPYLISVIDESIKWILRTTYKDYIIYSDSIATQDVNSVIGRDNLKTYCHNNTIGHLNVMAYNALEELFEGDKNEQLESFKNIIESLKEQSIISECFTYPILSKILDIPYRHFLTLSVSTSYMLNILLYSLFQKTFFEENYPYLHRMLLYYNSQRVLAKTTYKIKNIEKFLESFDHFLGFKNRTAVYEIYSSIIGKITKNEYNDLLSGNQIFNFPINQIELELVDFYNKYFSGKLDVELDKIRSKIDMDF